jgi:hypothetical protein
MTKDHIVAEIRRTAAENGGTPLGRQRFFAETGIKESDWSGKFWARWSDAVQEAGFAPNALNSARSDAEMLEALVPLVRELHRVPVASELKLRRRADSSFPDPKTFERFGTKSALLKRFLSFCRERGYDDVAQLCPPLASEPAAALSRRGAAEDVVIGSVYLLRSGRYFKIGRTNAVGRRGRELAIQLPDKSKIVHEIRTDDPAGIEDYWHHRFQDRRRNGEWFQLTAPDVAAFRRRKFM